MLLLMVLLRAALIFGIPNITFCCKQAIKGHLRCKGSTLGVMLMAMFDGVMLFQLYSEMIKLLSLLSS